MAPMMRDALILARRLRRASGDARVLFIHRIRIGSTIALFIFLLTHLG